MNNQNNINNSINNFNKQFKQAPTITKKKKSGSNVILRTYTAEYGEWGMEYEHYKENKELYAKLSPKVQQKWLSEKIYNLRDITKKMEWINANK